MASKLRTVCLPIGMYKQYKNIVLHEDLYIKEDLELLLTNTFKFTRKYDMEHCDVEVQNNPIDWGFVPFGDDEWKWVLHRMDYCIDLCIESIKTNDLKYALHSKQLIMDFIEQNNENRKSTKFRTLDTGIRLIVWDKCIAYFNTLNILSENEYNKICNSIQWQTQHLIDDYQEYHNFSNWGFMQAVGFLNSEKHINIKKENLKLYESRFLNHLKTQFYNDGIQWEQSSVYTMEVAIRMLQLNNPRYKTIEYYSLLEKVAKAMYALGDCDQKTILLGDGDRIDTIGFIQEVSYITRNKELLEIVAGSKLREEVYFNHGDDAYYFYKSLVRKPCVNGEYNFVDSGFYALKSSDRYLSFQNGTLGGGHGHFDNLHVNFSLNNQKILVDSGRYTYVDSYERKLFKSSKSHNGFSFEDEIYKYENPWDVGGKLNYTPITSKKIDNVVYLESSIHSGNMSAFRKMICLPEGDLIIIDTCNNKFDLNFITDFERKITIENEQYNIGESKVQFFGGKAMVEECFVSPKYNVMRQSEKIRVSNVEPTVFSFFSNKNSEINKSTKIKMFQQEKYKFPENQLYCFDIKCSENEYCLAVLPYEYGRNNNILEFDGILVMGSIVVINMKTKTPYIFKR